MAKRTKGAATSRLSGKKRPAAKRRTTAKRRTAGKRRLLAAAVAHDETGVRFVNVRGGGN
jgi:hypothetical protein